MQATPSARPQLRSILFAGVVFLLALLALAGVKSYRDLATVRQREAELEERLQATRTETHELERRIERLSHDPQMLERLAREELGMMRPDEVVIVLPAADEPASAR